MLHSALKETENAVMNVADRAQDLKADLVQDVAALPAAVQRCTRFYFMASDARCIYGLQDWPVSSWEHHLKDAGADGIAFMQSFLASADEDDVEAGAPRDSSNGQAWAESDASSSGQMSAARAAQLITERLKELLPLSDWKKVLRFQNQSLNRHHNHQVPPATYYLDAPILKHFMFARGNNHSRTQTPWTDRLHAI